MPAYLIAEFEVRDHDALSRVRSAIDKLISQHGGKFISRGSSVTPHLGSRPEHVSIIEFPSRQAAVDYANSSELEQLMELANEAAHWRTYIIEGGDRMEGGDRTSGTGPRGA